MKGKFPAKISFSMSMAIFGTIGVFTRLIPLSSSEIALYRAVLAAIVIALFLALSKKKVFQGIKNKTLVLLFLSGAAMGFNWILLFEAYNYASLTAATLSYYFAPTIVLLSSPIVMKERLKKTGVLCFLLSSLGLVMVIAGGGGGRGSDDLKGIFLGLGAAVLYATVILINKKIGEIDGIGRTFLQFISAIIVLTPYVLFKNGFNLIGLDPTGWLSLLVLGIVHTGMTYSVYFSSLPLLKGSEISLLSYIDPLTAMLISAFVLSEPTTLLQIAGGVLILGSTLFSELTKK